MVAITYGVARTAAPAKRAEKVKGLFARFFDALMEARRHQAEREIARHIHLYRGWHSESISFAKDELPFGGR